MPKKTKRGTGSNTNKNTSTSRSLSSSGANRNAGTRSTSPRIGQITSQRNTSASASSRLAKSKAERKLSQSIATNSSGRTLGLADNNSSDFLISSNRTASVANKTNLQAVQQLSENDINVLNGQGPQNAPQLAAAIKKVAGLYRSSIMSIAAMEKRIKDNKTPTPEEKASLERELNLLKFQKDEQSKLLSNQWYNDNFGETTFNEEVVLKQFGYNWFTLKDRLAYTNGDTTDENYSKQLAAMERLLEYRQKEVDQLLEQTKAEIEKETGEKVDAIAAGSISPTSDYDITFEMKGSPELEQLAVRRFNALFLQKFKVPSGVMFDTNVYTTGFMPTDGSLLKNLEYKDKMMELAAERNLPAVRKGKVEKHFAQLALSLLPIRQHLQNDKQWSDFLAGMREDMRFHILPHVDQQDRQKVEQVIDSGLARLFLNVENLDQETRFQLKKEIANIKRTQQLPPEVLRDADTAKMHIEAMAKDRLYEKTLDRVAIRLQALKTNTDKLEKETNKSRRQKLLKERAELITKFEKEQGKALVYANEAYFSGGAAVHVVKGLQAGGDFDLGKQQKMQSLLMNVGYKLQHFAHQQAENGIERAIIGTSKYGQRVNNLVSRTEPNEVALKGLLQVSTRQLLKDEDVAVNNYKKNDIELPTPTDKEVNVIALMQGKNEQVYAREVQDAFLEVAQNALGPYFLTKYRDQKKKDPENLGKFDTFWS